MLAGICFAQTPEITISNEYAKVWVDNKKLNTLKYSITNNGTEPYYLWLDKDCSQLSDSLKIKNYFKVNPLGGDGCLFLWMCDGHFEEFTSSIFRSFVKIVHPEERFDFIFTLFDEEYEEDTLMDIVSCLSIVARQEMIKQFPGSVIDVIDNSIMLYKPSHIVIPWKYFKEFIN